MKRIKLTTEVFILKAKKIHQNTYDYSNVVYGKNNKEKVTITCKIHGDFKQSPDSHLSGKGCKRCATIKSKTIHGLRHHSLYKKWDAMMQRCYNPKQAGYKNYGGRGIKVSEEFKNIANYINYIESLPNYTEGTLLQIDRIDNDGNYERGNIKLSSSLEQILNQRVRKDNKAGFTGISKILGKEKYRAYLNINGKQLMIGSFDTIEEAIYNRNVYIIENKLPHRLQ